MALKLADAFEVTLDSLVSERDIPDILRDQDMLDRWQNLEELSPEDRSHILSVIDSFLRDARARKTYGAS